jgi:hypothetical protein
MPLQPLTQQPRPDSSISELCTLALTDQFQYPPTNRKIGQSENQKIEEPNATKLLPKTERSRSLARNSHFLNQTRNSTNMKSLILGVMLASVSFSFAQSDGVATHQLKNRLKAKQMMKVQPAAMDINDNSEPKQFETLSREDSKSSIVSGIIRVNNGIPYIDVENGRAHRKMIPTNFTKDMLRDLEGKTIQFRYTLANQPVPNRGDYSMVINLHDVAIMKKR